MNSSPLDQGNTSNPDIYLRLIQRCFKVNTEDSSEIFLKEYSEGDVFGELALLYNAPRAANISALSSGTLFSLDRVTFNNVVRSANSQKRQLYQEFINKIELLSSLNSTEKMKICDCLEAKMFKKGEFVVEQGQVGSNFYLVQQGTAEAIKTNPNSGEGMSVYNKRGSCDELLTRRLFRRISPS